MEENKDISIQLLMGLMALSERVDELGDRLDRADAGRDWFLPQDYDTVIAERQDLEDELDAAKSYIEAVEAESRDLESENARLQARVELLEDLLSITVHEYKGVSSQLESLESGRWS